MYIDRPGAVNLPARYANILSQLIELGGPETVQGSYIRFNATSEDASIAINGVPITRITDSFTGLNQIQVEQRLALAAENYSEGKVARLLHYDSGLDYRLPQLQSIQKQSQAFNPYYLYYRLMTMSVDKFRRKFSRLLIIPDKEDNLSLRKEMVHRICSDNGVSKEELPLGYGVKRFKRELEDVVSPLVSSLKGKTSSSVLEVMVDSMAQRYTPEAKQHIREGASRMAGIFSELYKRAKRYGLLMPKDQQLITFFSQVAERVFDEETEPLNMFVVACPRYGEFDEYDRLEEGLSYTARTYLQALPLLTTVLTRYGVPFQGLILVNDTEEELADGALLERLGIKPESYKQKCFSNVQAVNQALDQDERITNFSAHLFTDAFPEFIQVTRQLQRRIFALLQQDLELRTRIGEIADTRLDRHRKIMGGYCDFSESLYLALHYSAEYLALGYLCRLYPELSGDSLIVNYNSPNVEQFNSQELLAKCMEDSTSPDTGETIPVIQVKFY